MKIKKKIRSFYREAYTLGHFPSISEFLFTKKKRMIYYGFLGDRNFGDELVFESSKMLFTNCMLIPYKKRMPVLLKAFCNLYLNKIDGVLIGGGTLIGPLWEKSYFLKLVKTRKQFFVHGTGVHNHIREVKEWSKILERSAFGGVRGPLSIQNLQQVPIENKIVGDAAFMMYAKKKRVTTSSKTVLINLGTHADYENGANCKLVLDEFVKYLLRENFKVVFLPFHKIDVELGNSLIEKYPEISMCKIPATYAEAATYFSDITFAIGERLHFIVMALLTNVPFLSINYAKKHCDLLESLSIKEGGIMPESISLKMVLKVFENRTKFNWVEVNEKILCLKSLQIQEFEKYYATVS